MENYQSTNPVICLHGLTACQNVQMGLEVQGKYT